MKANENTRNSSNNINKKKIDLNIQELEKSASIVFSDSNFHYKKPSSVVHGQTYQSRKKTKVKKT